MSWRERCVVVTGGAGFVGSHLALRLAAEGARVTVLDDCSAGLAENLVEGGDAVRLVREDVLIADLPGLLKDVEVVFHLAANADVPRSVREPALDFRVNALGSNRLFLACREVGVGRVVFASSAAVYGDPQAESMNEDHPQAPVSPYGASKVAAEQLGLAYARCWGFPFTAVRIFNSFGERQPRYVMYDVLRKLSGGPAVLPLLGTGAQVRDFTYVSDAVDLFLAAATTPAALGRSYNLCNGSQITIRDLAQRMVKLCGLEGRTRVEFSGESWPGDIQRLVGDPTRAKTELGFSPRVSLDEGLSRLLRWGQQHHSWRYD